MRLLDVKSNLIRRSMEYIDILIKTPNSKTNKFFSKFLLKEEKSI